MTQKVRIQHTGRFDIEAVLGLVERNGGLIEADVKFGFNAAVGTSAEGIHTPGGDIIFPTSAQTVRIKAGGDAADDAGGDGARSIRVTGIDDNLNRIEEDIVTNGADASLPTTALFWRVFRAQVLDVGLYGVANTAVITIENTSSAQVLVEIPVEKGQSQTSLVSTASKRPIVITHITLMVEATKVITFNLYVREAFTTVAAPFRAKRQLLNPLKVDDSGEHIPLDVPILIPELSDVWLEGIHASSSAEAGSAMSYYVVPVL